MSTLTPSLVQPGVLRHSPWDALLVSLALVHGAVLLAVPGFAVVALGLWWNSNTISHNFVHRPFFRWRWLNGLFALYLSVLLGIPQSIWRGRHLAHHAGVAWRPKPNLQMATEVLLVLALWAYLAIYHWTFFVAAYVPGYAAGLALCWLHGYYEHQRTTTSHYGFWYNLLFFNDGYHVEHHLRPGAHWTTLPRLVQRDATTSRWPAVLRWLDVLSLEGLERGVLFSTWLQRFMLRRHEQAFCRLLPALPESPRVTIVGGALFPRTLLVLRHLLPGASFVIIDKSTENIALARDRAGPDVRFVCASYNPDIVDKCDILVFPLAFSGDRTTIYRAPPVPLVFVHDWIWRPHGASVVISWLLLKRLNLVRPR